MSDTPAPDPCTVCGRADVIAATVAAVESKPSRQGGLHSMLGIAVLTGFVYFLYQLADMFSKVQDFSIYTTPPGMSELLKLLATVLVIVAAGLGLNLKTLIGNIVGGFMGVGPKNTT